MGTSVRLYEIVRLPTTWHKYTDILILHIHYVWILFIPLLFFKSIRHDMEKNVFIIFFIPFVFVCLQKEINAYPEGTKAQIRMFKRIQRKQPWEDMWFDEFGGEDNWMPKDIIWSQDYTVGTMSRLRMISPMLGCSYGVELQWFLRLALESIDACNELQQNENVIEDCRSEVRRSIEKDPFYQALSLLEDFYTGQTEEIFSGIVPGGLKFNTLLMKGAESLGNFLVSTCSPKCQLFDVRAIKDAHAAEGHTDYIYLFCVTKLDSYTDFIDDHLTKLRLTPW
ncbi:uncharacterized protein LOC126839654 [Adelges cooleyi]|uniref:uncharacterized protein LOC126839654 n=1 Tax=Adelges cooleyi TaxID=133065 RepID=UPI00217FE481|nr:uncharacterized protein LOC126839654 [Adelges cooleyi]